MCMCKSDHRWRPPRGMEAVSGQAGITVSNTIRIIITGIHNFFLEPKCD